MTHLADSLHGTKMSPFFEHIITDAGESFLWRLDDYPWQRNVWNFHPEFEIHLIRKSSGVAYVGDYIGPFCPGHLAVIGGGLPHDWVTGTRPGELISNRDIVVQFDAQKIRTAAAALPEFADLEEFFARCGRGLAFRGAAAQEGAALIEAMDKPRGFARLLMFFELLHLLSTTVEYDVLSSPNFVPELNKAAVDVIQKALIYIVDNHMKAIRLRDIASLSDMSESAMSRFFLKNTGNSFTEHVTKLRLYRTCILLTETTMPITDICFGVGFTNLSNFNRNFLRQYRMTPSSYRRLAKHRRHHDKPRDGVLSGLSVFP